jgi:hypothetical protein
MPPGRRRYEWSFCGGKPWRNLSVRAQLVRASESDHVPFPKVSKNLNQTAAGRTGLDVHPLGLAIFQAHDEYALERRGNRG